MPDITIQPLPDGGHRLQAHIWLPRPIEEVFAFFADAANLQTLTPPSLSFQILTPRPIDMHAGTLIDYKLKLRHIIPIKWHSEITLWDPPHRFEDTQLRGPYRRWEHRHSFEEKDGGTLALDQVDYAVPGGRLTHALFVQRDIRNIFTYRHQKLLEHFGGESPA